MPRFLANGLVALSIGGTVVGCDRTQTTSPSPAGTGFTISGVVHQPAPEADVLLANARVQITGNTKLQEAVITDAQGRFKLPPTSVTDFELMFSKEGYLDTRYAVTALTADRIIDVVVPPLTVTRVWSGSLTSEQIGATIYSRLNGWPGDYVFEAHHADAVTLELEVGCLAHGTYTDFGFQMLHTDQPKDPTTLEKPFYVYADGSGQSGGTLKYRYTASYVALPGTYRLIGSLDGYIGNPCPWTLRFTRPG